MTARFSVGQLVHLRVNADRSGPVITVLDSVEGRHRYQVFHGPADIATYYEEQLEPAETRSVDPFRDAFLRREFMSPQEFAARLTAERLKHPLTDNLYAMHAARIEFIPFQLKPVMRILRSDRPRLLIADEVGVGKTIEAGLILKELSTRQSIERVLIVCPKALTTKWRLEMRRFDEEFVILSSESLHYCLKETHLDRVWPAQYARAIVSLELLRGETVLFGSSSHPGLVELQSDLGFDMLVLDEAHHVRNPNTNGNAALSILCDVTEAVVFLSATPIQTASENLYHLLHLLRPDLFYDTDIYNILIEPNQHLAQAARLLRALPNRSSAQKESWEALQKAAQTSWGRSALANRPTFQSIAARLTDARPLDDLERISCIRDIEELHTLAHILNRTRRRDIGAFTVREAHTIQVEFTDHQREWYERWISARYESLRSLYDPSVARMVIVMLERQATSCLPALVQRINRNPEHPRLLLADLTDVDEFDDGDISSKLDKALSSIELPDVDSMGESDAKFDALRDILDSTLQSDGPKKLLLFSYFVATLSYLQDRLIRLEYRVGLITGLTPDEDREALRTRFAEDHSSGTAIDILLSSEVGCEGLDYQFCDRLVNYDIPWNPMRLEQRIGRIDRHGQASPKVMIYNFVTLDTVEERIYFRCFERLGLFEHALGDLEEVMGNLVDRLDKAILSRQLSDEQKEKLALQEVAAALGRIEETRRLEEATFQSLTLDALIVDEVEQLADQGRYVSPSQVELMIRRASAEAEANLRLSTTEQPNVLRLRVPEMARKRIDEYLRHHPKTDRVTRRFRLWLEKSQPSEPLLVTFDQRTSLERRDLEFVTPLHPLARWAIHQLSSSSMRPITVVAAAAEGAASWEIFVLERWETVALQPDVTVKVWRFSSETESTERATLASVYSLLLEASTHEDCNLFLQDWDSTIQRLDQVIATERETASLRLKDRNSRSINEALSTLAAHFGNRLARIEASTNTRDERIKRMKLAEAKRVQAEYDRRREAIEARRDADILTQRLAILIQVSGGQ